MTEQAEELKCAELIERLATYPERPTITNFFQKPRPLLPGEFNPRSILESLKAARPSITDLAVTALLGMLILGSGKLIQQEMELNSSGTSDQIQKSQSLDNPSAEDTKRLTEITPTNAHFINLAQAEFEGKLPAASTFSPKYRVEQLGNIVGPIEYGLAPKTYRIKDSVLPKLWVPYWNTKEFPSVGNLRENELITSIATIEIINNDGSIDKFGLTIEPWVEEPKGIPNLEYRKTFNWFQIGRKYPNGKEDVHVSEATQITLIR